jgi:hypothetical protein
VFSDDGYDFSFTLGWKYEFENGLGFNAGYEMLNLGKYIDIQGFDMGLSYRL